MVQIYNSLSRHSPSEGCLGCFQFFMTKAAMNIRVQVFFFFWLCWVFIAAHGLSLVEASRGYPSVVCRLLIVVASLAAQHGL